MSWKSHSTKKMLEYLNKLPRRVREGTSRDEMPEKIIQHYGLEESIPAISKAVDEIPRKDEDVQNLLHPFMDWLKTQDEKENQAKKRKLNEVEDEERSAPEKKRKLSEPKEGQRSAADPLMSCQTAEERRHPSWKIPIRDLKSRDQLLETEAFFGKVVEISVRHRYENQDGKEKFILYLGVADETASIKVMVYNQKLLKFFKKGRSYMFRNMIKDKNVVKLTKPSTVSETRPVKVPEELELEAQKLIHPESELYSIDEAKKCPIQTYVSVEGTVEEIALVEDTSVSHQPEKVKTQRLKLRDETGSIWICMWGENTRQCSVLSFGDVVKTTNMTINNYHGNIELNSTDNTKVQKVKTVGVQRLKIEIVGIIKATKTTTHLEAGFNQQVHTLVVGSPLLMKELDIKLSRGLQSSLVDKVPFTADIEIRGNRISKIKVVSVM